MYGTISAVVQAIVVVTFFKISYSVIPIKYRAVIGRISSASIDICISFAKSTVMLLIAPVFGCLFFLANPIIRTLMTYQVDKDEQGAMLSVITAATTVFQLINTVASAQLYKATEQTWDGCIYFVSSMLQFTSALLMVWYMILTRHDPDPVLADEDQKNIVLDTNSEEDIKYVKQSAD